MKVSYSIPLACFAAASTSAFAPPTRTSHEVHRFVGSTQESRTKLFQVRTIVKPAFFLK